MGRQMTAFLKILLTTLVLNFSGLVLAATPLYYNNQAPTTKSNVSIYYTDYVHLEPETMSQGTNWNQATYDTFKKNILDLANYVSTNNLTLDVGVSLPWIWADFKWGDGKLYATLDSMKGIDVLPHTHNDLDCEWDGGTYRTNEADVAHVLTMLGVEDHGVVSGGTAESIYSSFSNGQGGSYYSGIMEYHPIAVQGGGVKGHKGQTNDSGLWYISSDGYYTTGATSGLIAMGGGGQDAATAVSYYRTGYLDSTKLNCFSDIINDSMLMANYSDGTSYGLAKVKVDEATLSSYVVSGVAQWMTSPAVVNLWLTKYNGQSSMQIYGVTAY
jgi:hypothetical protein